MTTNTDETDSIVGKCPKCKRLVYAVVNKDHCLDGEHRRTVARLVKDGFNIEHMTVSAVREAPWSCECK